MKRYIALLLALYTFHQTSQAQQTVAIKLLAGNYYFAPNTSPTNPSSGFISEHGGQLSIEQYLSSRTIALKINQGLFSNAEKRLAGYTQLHLKFRLYHRKHSLSISAGPAIYYQKHIKKTGPFDLPGTKPDYWEQNIAWVSGEVEYAYYLNSSWRAIIGVSQTTNESVALSIGFRKWLRAKAKACDCPSFGKSH